VTKSSGKHSPLFRSLAEKAVWSFVLPTRRIVIALLAGAAPAAAGFALGWGWLPFWLYNGALAGLSVVDLAMLPPKRTLRAERILPERVEQGRPFDIRLRLSHGGGAALSMEAADDLPPSFSSRPVLKAMVGSDTEELLYRTQAAERGDFPLRYLYVRYSGLLGLWKKQARMEAAESLRVYPDLTRVRGIMASLQNTFILDGKRLQERSRGGLEFAYIRDYTPDDDPRMLNWTASARADRLMVNVRQPERGKIVTLMIDCGRLMGVELEGQVKLDLAIEAALSLAAVVLRQGDQAAALVFSGEIRAYVPPGRGMGHLQTIVEAIYALKSDPSEAHYGLALEYLMRVQRKRSLVVLFSDMENYLFEEELGPYLLKLRRAHPVLLLSLEDPVLAAWTRTKVNGLSEAYARSAAQAFRLDRKRFTGRMAALGIHALDVPAGKLALAAVNHYLELKSRDSL
jgi:uncharacterized protein (DUF58 family)